MEKFAYAIASAGVSQIKRSAYPEWSELLAARSSRSTSWVINLPLKDHVEAIITRLGDHQNILYGDKGKTGLINQSLKNLLPASPKRIRQEPERIDPKDKWV